MFVILFLYLTGVCYCQVPVDDLPTYVLNFDSPLYVCNDVISQGFVDTSGVEMQRCNETTTYMTGMINFLKGIDADTMVEVLVDKEMSGHFEMMISHEFCVLCDEIRNSDSPYKGYMQAFAFPDKCPFEAAPYPVNDLTAGGNDFPINAATAGRYQVTINFYKNPDGTCKNEKTFIGCLKLDFIIEPL